MEIIRYVSENIIKRLKNNEIDIHRFFELCNIENIYGHYWQEESDRRIIQIKIIIPEEQK